MLVIRLFFFEKHHYSISWMNVFISNLNPLAVETAQNNVQYMFRETRWFMSCRKGQEEEGAEVTKSRLHIQSLFFCDDFPCYESLSYRGHRWVVVKARCRDDHIVPEVNQSWYKKKHNITDVDILVCYFDIHNAILWSHQMQFELTWCTMPETSCPQTFLSLPFQCIPPHSLHKHKNIIKKERLCLCNWRGNCITTQIYYERLLYKCHCIKSFLIPYVPRSLCVCGGAHLCIGWFYPVGRSSRKELSSVQSFYPPCSELRSSLNSNIQRQ